MIGQIVKLSRYSYVLYVPISDAEPSTRRDSRLATRDTIRVSVQQSVGQPAASTGMTTVCVAESVDAPAGVDNRVCDVLVLFVPQPDLHENQTHVRVNTLLLL